MKTTIKLLLISLYAILTIFGSLLFAPIAQATDDYAITVFIQEQGKTSTPSGSVRVESSPANQLIGNTHIPAGNSNQIHMLEKNCLAGDYKVTFTPDTPGYNDVPTQTVSVGPDLPGVATFDIVPIGGGSFPPPSPSPSGGNTSIPTTNSTSGAASAPLIKLNRPEVFSIFSNLGKNFSSIDNAIPALFTIIVYASSIAFLILFLVGGIQYLTSAGNEEASGKAKKLLVDAVVGLLIVLIAWAAGSWILGQLGINIT